MATELSLYAFKSGKGSKTNKTCIATPRTYAAFPFGKAAIYDIVAQSRPISEPAEHGMDGGSRGGAAGADPEGMSLSGRLRWELYAADSGLPAGTAFFLGASTMTI